MKTIKDYEKEFDDKFRLENNTLENRDVSRNYTIPSLQWGELKDISELKNYIFQELLPQVLSEILPKGTIIEENIMNKYKEFLNSKQKAKEMGIKI